MRLDCWGSGWGFCVQQATSDYNVDSPSSDFTFGKQIVRLSAAYYGKVVYLDVTTP